MLKYQTICIFLIIIHTTLESPACPPSSYCQTCKDDDTNCGMCYTWGTKSINAYDKTWDENESASACNSNISTLYKVIGCEQNFLLSKETSWKGITLVLPIVHPRCSRCESDKFLNYNNSHSNETCSDTAPEGMICPKLLGCDQTVCVNDAMCYSYCIQCSSGYYPIQGSLPFGMVFRTIGCSQEIPIGLDLIANCIQYEGSGPILMPSYGCNVCEMGYAINMSKSVCLSFTSDPNCLQLQGFGNCYACFPGYYFEWSICTKYSGVFVVFLGFIWSFWFFSL